jgi:hypothetical protein
MARRRSRKLRSPEALGLTMQSRHRPAERARLKVERLRNIPLGDFVWKELRQEYNLYVRLFPRGAGRRCKRCNHPKTLSGAWVHIPDPMPGERACQPDGELCDCKGFERSKEPSVEVARAARWVRAAANRAWKGTSLPKFERMEKKMTVVYAFVSKRV